MRRIRGADAVKRRLITPGHAVRNPHQFPFEQTRDVSARVIMRGVGNAQALCELYQTIAGEIVPQRGVVVF